MDVSPETANAISEKTKERASHDPGGGWWISSIMQAEAHQALYWQDSINKRGKIVYALSLLLAILTLLAVLYSVVKHRLSVMKKIHKILFLLSITLSLIIITDFAFSAYWFKDETFLISNLFWILPVILLFRITFSKKERTRFQPAKIKSFLMIVLFPLAICAIVYVCYLASQGFIGVLSFFLGLNLLSLTYLNIVRSDQVKTLHKADEMSTA